MNQFAERYKTFTNAQLIRIIDNQIEYQQLAIEAAENELAQRQLTDEELDILKTQNETQERENQIQKDKKEAFENKVKDITVSITDTLNPIRTASLSTNQVINRISIAFGLLFLFQAFTQIGLIVFIFTNSQSKWDFGVVAYLLPILVLPVATLLFWRRKKYGWILLFIFLIYSVLTTIVSFILDFRSQHSGVEVIDNLFPVTSPATYLMRIFLFGACLWLICKNNIREVYSINKQTILITAGIGIALTGIIIF
jgi:hypothetical protein